MGLVYIFNQWAFNCRTRGLRFKIRVPHWFSIFPFHFLTLTKKMIEILTKIRAKITIIVVENREPYYFIIICKFKEVRLSLFSYQMLASTFDYRWASSYYKVCGETVKVWKRYTKLQCVSATRILSQCSAQGSVLSVKVEVSIKFNSAINTFASN